MADTVLRWFSRISRLSDHEYRRLVTLLKAGRELPPSPDAERQRRHRARPVTVTRDSHTNNGRDNGVTVTRDNGRDGHNVESISKSLAFDLFWQVYPKHIGKGEAEKAWKRGSCESKAEVILTAVREQMAYFEAQGSKYTPNPATWLNQKRWQDDPPKPSLLSEKTRGNIANLQAFVDGVHRDEQTRLAP